mmetsp:Transcript_74729/g.178314  ORF Transcript_74729/g.178314 Transcript_74729/m.178314 type:complete len:203 (-) Transcript_74729:50-658(-)
MLAKLLEGARLCCIRQGLLPQMIQPLHLVVELVLTAVGLLRIRHEKALLHELITQSIEANLLKKHPGLCSRSHIHHSQVVANESTYKAEDFVAKSRKVRMDVGRDWRHRRARRHQSAVDVPEHALHGGAARTEPKCDRCIVPVPDVEVLVWNGWLVGVLVIISLRQSPPGLGILRATGTQQPCQAEAQGPRCTECHRSGVSK